MDANAIIDGIRDKFRADMGAGTVYALTGGDLWLQHAANVDEADAPYIIVTLIDIVPTRVFGDSTDIEQARIQFDIWSRSESMAEIGPILAALDVCYQDADFGYGASYQHMNMHRTAVRLMREDQYWRHSVDYLLTVHEV